MPKGINLVRSIYESQDIPIEVKVRGEIPKWLQGTLYRNGPGRFKFGEKTYKHLFDGMACINKFQIKDGKVYYSNKLLETESYKKTVKNQNLEAMLGTENTSSSIFDRFKAIFNINKITELDNVNVNVIPFGNDQMYALSETSMISRVNPQTLEIMNTENLTKHIQPTFSSIAHPHFDGDGSWISVGMQPKSIVASYDFIKFENKKGLNNICEGVKFFTRIPSSHFLGLSYFHSFGLTENYIIFLEGSLIFDFKLGLLNSIILNKPYTTCFKMYENFMTKIYVIERKTGKVLPQKWFTDPQVTFHHINAYESENNLIVDVCSYEPKDFDINNFSYDEKVYEEKEDFLFLSKAYAKRITIPLNVPKNKEIYCEFKFINDKTFMELPVINYNRFNSKFYSFVYGIGSTQPPHSIVKINVNHYNDSIIATLDSENDIICPSEPIFVENPEAKSEDDGVLLTLVLGNKYDYLAVLDAKDLKEIARAELPQDIKATYSFHGFFADKTNYDKLNV